MKTYSRKQCRGAFTLVELLILLGVVALLVSTIVPWLAEAKHRTSKIGCVNNLRQIELSFKTWAVDNGDKVPMQVSAINGGTMEFAVQGMTFVNFEVMSNELSATKLLLCPNDTGRKWVPTFGELSDENISYFVGIDANDAYTNSILTGDRNLSMNGKAVKPGLVEMTTNSLAGWTEEMHQGKGNLGMGDGSVRQVLADGLREALASSGFVTNRLAVP